MKKLLFILNLIFLSQGLFPPWILGNNKSVMGTIQGTLLDKETKAPLWGGNITIINTQFGTATDKEGKFTISNVPVGNYTLKLSYIGYESSASS